MDHFEAIMKTVLEESGYWVRQSFKVELTKEEKREIGKPSTPRPEIDLLALDIKNNTLVAFEAKSFLDSHGVMIAELQESYDLPTGRYKLFTCDRYRRIVLKRLRIDLRDAGLLGPNVTIRLGLIAGHVYRGEEDDLKSFCDRNGWYFWGPTRIKNKLKSLAKKGYTDNPVIISAKLMLR